MRRRSTMITLKPTIKLSVSHFENESEPNKPRIDSYVAEKICHAQNTKVTKSMNEHQPT